MSRYRLDPTPAQEVALLGLCGHARFVWNLAIEQWNMWSRDKGPTPGFAEQCRQLTEARAANDWLAGGSQTVQQQALRDFDQARRNFNAGTHGRPGWRRRGISEGFRIVGPAAGRTAVLNRRWARVLIPKVGWVRFRITRDLGDAKSYRITRDQSGRWHIAFVVIPEPIPAPGTGEVVVGVDRGITVSAALSTGELLQCPTLTSREQVRLKHLQRRLARAKSGSSRRQRVRLAIAKLMARGTDRRKDWVEQTSTGLARRFDVIRVEDLRIRRMTRSPQPRANEATAGTYLRNGSRAKAALNRGILSNGWGFLVERLEQKAQGRVEKVSPAYTSQTCSGCGIRDREARESQAVFRCRSCGHTANADINAAMNIAAGRAVTARGALISRALKREPQLATSA